MSEKLRVLVLSPHAEILSRSIRRVGDEPIVIDYNTLPEDWPDVDRVVSFGYHHIIKGYRLHEYKGRMVNIHISMLPYNRGASPNFWSWFDDTPKGVSIHMIDGGIDTGHLQVCKEMNDHDFSYGRNATLSTTYYDLIMCGLGLFNREWINLRNPHSKVPVSKYQLTPGSVHRAGEEEAFLGLINTLSGPTSYTTLVDDVARAGRIYRGE